MNERIDVLSVLRRVESLFNEREYPATYEKLVKARFAIADLVVSAGRYYHDYCQDEADGWASLDDEHRDAVRALRDALLRIGEQP